MNIAIAVLIGYILSFGHDATSSSVENRRADLSEQPSAAGYVPVPPGTRIYFHSVRNGKLLVGPKLKSDGDVTIYTIGRSGELASSAGEKSVKYTVLKSGVLVPKKDETGESDNKNVYKSQEPTFYVKGFKDILIPINLIYSKSKQKAIIDTEALLTKQLVEAGDTFGEKNETISEQTTKRKGKKATQLIEDLLSRLPSDSEPVFKPKKPDNSQVGGLAPDKNCNGEITMFILKSDGVFQRMPPDPYLPMGIQLSYTVKDSFLIRPRNFENANDFIVNYLTGKNGDLIPHADNSLKMRAKEGELVSFILGECGSLIPVQEERDRDKHINYYYNGQLIFKGEQFPHIFSNSEFIVINDEKHKLPGKGDELEENNHRIRKRSLYSEEFIVEQPTRYYPAVEPPFRRPSLVKQATETVLRRDNIEPPMHPVVARPTPEYIAHHPPPSLPIHHHQTIPGPVFEQPFASISPPGPPVEIPLRHQTLSAPAAHYPNRPEPPRETYRTPYRLRVRTDLYCHDDKGVKISLIPEITEQNDVVLYKLTCKGYLVRYPPCKEPEYGFEIHFQLLLDEFILVPINKPCRANSITYVLQENGDLIPLESNEVTFKKAPGSLLYFMLGKNNVLFPIQQKVGEEGGVSFYYQDYHLLDLPSTSNKPLHFSTLSRPLFAFFNGVTVITTSSKPRLNPSKGSNWKNHNRNQCNNEIMSKDIFLSGPSGQLIRVSPFKTKSGSTVIYELDCNGILYRSPKDKKKCIILKSYILLKEGILLPSNDTTGYMYMTSKNGDMFPYLFPDGKLKAPVGESVRYLLCEKGILLPMELEIVDDHICYFFQDVMVYRERVFCKHSLSTLTENTFKLHYRLDCEGNGKMSGKFCNGGIKPFITDDGDVVYYRKSGKILKRHPPDEVPPYLTYTMGSFEIQPDGSLFQTQYQDPDHDVVNLMLEPNGDLMEDSRNEVPLKHSYYLLDVNGNLVAVDGRRTRKTINFYKNHVKVCKSTLPDPQPIQREVAAHESKQTPLGRDPLKLLQDPEPKRIENEAEGPHSMFIPVPLKSVPVPCLETVKNITDNKRCEDMSESLALELEINDEVIAEIKNWAAKCDKLLSRREVEQSLTEALQGVNVAGLLKDDSEAR